MMANFLNLNVMIEKPSIILESDDVIFISAILHTDGGPWWDSFSGGRIDLVLIRVLGRYGGCHADNSSNQYDSNSRSNLL